MKRALVAALAALAAVPAAHAGLPVYKSSSIGEGLPFKAYASITPTVDLFGDSITAKVAVVADTHLVDPTRLRVRASFKPYEPTKPPSILRVRIGRFAQVTWTWTLRCITSPCVPRSPNDHFHIFHFPSAHVEYLKANDTPAYGIDASWPPVEVDSQISPGVVAFLQKTNRLNWRIDLTPVAAPTYRVSPTLLYWLALAAAGLFGLAALALAGRWYLLVRPQRAAIADEDSASTLERALAVLRYAHEHGDETLQRKAFERVAGELGVERADELTRVARELAWSARTPEDEEVEEFAEQARETQEADA
ncbi:MAG TPA: hypothetical protein VFA30_00395 [Gaiellaceae bacterium]|nr:hypothetical protein [Gaiellaceae bacterium]